MAIKNKSVEIKGDEAKVAALQIYPQPDGNVVIVVTGQTRDGDGRPVALKEAQIVYAPGANDAMDDLLAGGLAALRKANGLEDGPISFEPVADVAAKLMELRAAAAPQPAPADPAPKTP